MFGGGVCWERIHGDHHWDAEGADVFNLLHQVLRTSRHCRNVLGAERWVKRLAGNNLADATMHLQRANRRHNHRSIRGKTGGATLDVEELLCTHIGAESCLGHHDLVCCECSAVGNDGVVPMRNVCERSGMYERWTTFKRLQQVWLDCITQ